MHSYGSSSSSLFSSSRRSSSSDKNTVTLLVAFFSVHATIWFLSQTLAVWNYDTVSSWKLQEPRSLTDPAVVTTNQALAVANTTVMLPLFLVAR